MEQRPYLSALYLLTAIIISSLAAYKCKSLKRICRRRRVRRRRKPRTHYYYLNKTSGEQMDDENNVVDPLMGDKTGADGRVDLSYDKLIKSKG